LYQVGLCQRGVHCPQRQQRCRQRRKCYALHSHFDFRTLFLKWILFNMSTGAWVASGTIEKRH
jgi:hypothetical protein